MSSTAKEHGGDDRQSDHGEAASTTPIGWTWTLRRYTGPEYTVLRALNLRQTCVIPRHSRRPLNHETGWFTGIVAATLSSVEPACQRYAPTWLVGFDAVAAHHGERLRGLVGRTLSSAWLLWDTELDEWFREGPVLLAFSGVQVEVNHQKFSDLSITWNTVDPTMRDSTSLPDEPPLVWRRDAVPELLALQGRTLTRVDLLELTWRDSWSRDDAVDLRRVAQGAVSPSFVFGDDRLTIRNGLDQNDLAFGAPADDQRVWRLSGEFTSSASERDRREQLMRGSRIGKLIRKGR